MKTLFKIGIFLMMFFISLTLHAQYNAGIGSGTEGIKHTYVGVDAGANATYAAIDNSFFGTGAGYNNTSGDYNTFLGMAAGYRNTDGKSNTFVGMYTGVYNTTGNWNTFLGMKAGRDNTTGNSNTFVGTGAGHDNTVGKRNSFFGTNAGRTINGDDNTFIGVNAGFNSSTGSSNTVVGTEGGYSSAGSSNVFIGRKAGRNSRGSRNVFIGNEAGAYVGAYSSDPENDKLYIENGSHNAPLIKGDFADQTLAIYGRVGINGAVNQNDELYVNGSAFAIDGWLVPSDKRYKKDIQTIDSALDKVNALNGVTYSFKQETINNIDFSKQKGEKQIGVIAQELEEVLPELVRKDESGYYAVNYDGLVPVLVEAVKEQQDEITDLRTRLEKLESLLNDTGTIQDNRLPVNENIDRSKVVLNQNAPNPFSGNTTIEYQLPDGVGVASLVVSDLNGRTVATYTISEKGNVQFNTGGLDNGVYTYAIIANGQSIAARKMVIQK